MTTTAMIARLAADYTAARDASRAAQAASSAALAPLYERGASDEEYTAARAAAGLPTLREEFVLLRAMEHARDALATALRVAAKRVGRSFGDASDAAVCEAHLAA